MTRKHKESSVCIVQSQGWHIIWSQLSSQLWIEPWYSRTLWETTIQSFPSQLTPATLFKTRLNLSASILLDWAETLLCSADDHSSLPLLLSPPPLGRPIMGWLAIPFCISISSIFACSWILSMVVGTLVATSLRGTHAFCEHTRREQETHTVHVTLGSLRMIQCQAVCECKLWWVRKSSVLTHTYIVHIHMLQLSHLSQVHQVLQHEPDSWINLLCLNNVTHSVEVLLHQVLQKEKDILTQLLTASHAFPCTCTFTLPWSISFPMVDISLAKHSRDFPSEDDLSSFKIHSRMMASERSYGREREGGMKNEGWRLHVRGDGTQRMQSWGQITKHFETTTLQCCSS